MNKNVANINMNKNVAKINIVDSASVQQTTFLQTFHVWTDWC